MKKSHDTVRASWESSRRRREVNGIKADDQNDSRPDDKVNQAGPQILLEPNLAWKVLSTLPKNNKTKETKK